MTELSIGYLNEYKNKSLSESEITNGDKIYRIGLESFKLILEKPLWEAFLKSIIIITTSKSDKEMAVFFAKDRWAINQSEIEKHEIIKNVKKWTEFKSVLEKNRIIDTLMFFGHGFPGGISIGGQSKHIGSFARDFGEIKPQIKSVIFNGCNIGKDPESLFQFAKSFKTIYLEGFNHFWVTLPIDINRKNLKEKYSEYGGYFIPGTPSIEDLIKNKKALPKMIFAEWFRLNRDSADLPPKGEDRSKFKKRKDAEREEIKTEFSSSHRVLIDNVFRKIIINVSYG